MTTMMMFIPINGAPIPNSALFAMLAAAGGLYYSLYRRQLGRVDFKLKPNRYDTAFDVQLKKRNFAQTVSVEHNNVDCMQNKGYHNILESENYRRNMYSFRGEDMSKDRIINACIECDANTVVHYKYKNPIFGGTKHVTKTFKWKDYYQDRIK
jgi:hypothetical protein